MKCHIWLVTHHTISRKFPSGKLGVFAQDAHNGISRNLDWTAGIIPPISDILFYKLGKWIWGECCLRNYLEEDDNTKCFVVSFFPKWKMSRLLFPNGSHWWFKLKLKLHWHYIVTFCRQLPKLVFLSSWPKPDTMCKSMLEVERCQLSGHLFCSSVIKTEWSMGNA